MDVEELLTLWELEDLIPVFKDQLISLKVLETIDGPLLKELIPIIGHRLTFILKREEYLRSKGQDGVHTPLLESESCVDGTIIEVLAVEPAVTSSTPLASTTVSTAAALRTPILLSSAGSSKAGSSSTVVSTENARPSNSTINVGASCSSTLPNSSSFVKDIAAQFCLKQFIAEIDITTVLSKHLSASVALSFYNDNSFLNGSNRTAIVDALVSHLFVHARDFGAEDSIKNKHLEILAKRIKDYFDGEKVSTYYTAPTKKTTAGGKLTHKLRNIRKRKPDTASKSSHQRSHSHDDPAESLRSAPIDPNVDVDGAISFLAFTRTPWPEVEEKWALTHQYRLKQLERDPHLDKYFESWPVLQTPTGCTLLESDFNSLWPGRDVVIYSKWPVFEAKVLKLAETDAKDRQSKEIFKLLKPNTTADGRTAIALSLLPALSAPTQKLKLPNGKLWLPSIAEARSSMILHAQNANKLRSKLKEYTETVRLQGQRVHPLVIVVGPTLDKITKSYVCIDKVLWATSCVMKSIDLCFKATFALETEYPVQSGHLWEAIQKCIYKMTTNNDKYNTTLDNLV